MSRFTEKLAAVEAALIALIARIAPWLPPLPTAWLVLDRCVRYLGWPRWVAAAAGLAVECLGLLVTLTALELYSYNRARLKSEPRAPLAIPLALSGIYLTVAELLTLGLDLAPRLIAGEALSVAMLAPACFPPLSLVGMVLLAVRYDHQARLAENAEAAARRRDARRGRRASKREQGELAQPAGELAVTVKPGLRELDRARLLLLREQYSDGGAFTRAEAEAVTGLRATATGRLLAALVEVGELRAAGGGRFRRYHFDRAGESGQALR